MLVKSNTVQWRYLTSGLGIQVLSWDQRRRLEIRKVDEIAKERRWRKTYYYVIEERR